MTDGEALRRAIVADPDDDTPRLVYADWLDENRQPERAAFIRAQVEAARCEPFSPPARAAQERARQLLTAHRTAWTDHLADCVVASGFDRGFVHHVTARGAIPERVFDLEPVRSVMLVRHGTVEDLDFVPITPAFEGARLRQITRLDLGNVGLIPEEGYKLTESPHLAGLRELVLRANPLSPPWVADLIAGPQFPNLTALDVSDVPNLGPAVLRGTLRAERRFTKLHLSGVKFNSDQLQLVLQQPALSQVDELRLGWAGQPDNPGPLAYLQLGWLLPWENLRVLDLAGQHIGAEGVREIARHPDAAKLRWLGLASNAIGADGADLLVGSPYLNLFHLDVRGNDLDHADVEKLRDRFPDAVVLA
jgi:uncharacterized protein (TIGR02996 family)